MIENPWKHRCWLLVSPRSGSTYFQYLLNLNAGVPLQPLPTDRQLARYSFGEHLNKAVCDSWNQFVALDPIVSRIHCHQFGHFPLRRLDFREQFPGMRFILLERRDLIAQAASLALSNSTGITHCSEGHELLRYRDLSVDISTEQLLNCYRDVQQYQRFWRNWLHSEPYLLVTYESLIEFPKQTIAQTLDFLNVKYSDISLEVPLHKLEHPQTQEFKQRLQAALHEDESTTSASYQLVTTNSQ